MRLALCIQDPPAWIGSSISAVRRHLMLRRRELRQILIRIQPPFAVSAAIPRQRPVTDLLVLDRAQCVSRYVISHVSPLLETCFDGVPEMEAYVNARKAILFCRVVNRSERACDAGQ